MNLISYKKGDLEVIDQSTLPLFEERFAGLGALIGPHFHRRKAEVVPKIEDESLFPHIARVKAKGVADPFSHGIARYAPWQATATSNKVKATLSGKDLWNNVPMSALEGQNFKMNFQAELTPQGLLLNLDIVSDTDSLVGIHYYYHLPNNNGKIITSVQPTYINQGEKQPLPTTWNVENNTLSLNLDEEIDFTFFPYPNPREGKITLDTGSYQLITSYSCPSQENCWQLYHPKNASFVCIEPISSQDPRHPNLSVSSINISLEIK
jgi:galactose mutarotase-like enzyme